MSLSLRTRLALYLIALGVAAGTFATIGATASAMRAFWSSRIQRWETESTDSAAECRAAVRELHFRLLRYELSGNPRDKAEFIKSEEALAAWIDERTRAVEVLETRQVLGEIRQAFTAYSARAHELLNLVSTAAHDPSAREMLERIEQDAGLLMQIDVKLRAAQSRSLRALIIRARRDVDWIWRIFYGCMAALFVCGAILARIVYRDMIAPLRLTAIRSRKLLEHHEKLSALGLLTAGIAHEIRNPLNSIKARLFTQRRLLGADSPGIEDNEFIEGEIDRLEAIVQDSLQFARPASPLFVPQPLGAMVHSLCELVRPNLQESNIAVHTEFQTDAEFSFDASQLKQALLNLINNAAESIGQNGVVTVRLRVGFMPRGRARIAAVLVEVQDSGPGVPREVQARLFDPFFTTKEEGTGLGLPITARIVQAHGGWVECESRPGHGALFRIWLPLHSTHEKQPHPAH